MTGIGSVFTSAFRRKGGGGLAALGLDLWAGVDLSGQVIVSGTSLTIAAPSVFAGTYDLTGITAQTGPVFIVGPTYSGTIGAGNTLTGVNGLVVARPEHGPVTFGPFAWTSDLDTNSTGPTRVMSADDEYGLTLSQTATNSAGQTTGTAVLVELYSEGAVQIADPAVLTYLASPTPLPSAIEQSLWFVSVDIVDGNAPAGDPSRYLMEAGGGWQMRPHREADGTNGHVFRTQNRLSFDGSWQTGESTRRINYLLDWRTTTSGGSNRMSYQWEAGGWAWNVEWTSSVATASWDLSGNPMHLFNALTPSLAAQWGGETGFRHSVHRIAVWNDVAADIEDPALHAVLTNASGGTRPPALSWGALGTPLIDFNGPASRWAAGEHDGSLGAFTLTGQLQDRP